MTMSIPTLRKVVWDRVPFDQVDSIRLVFDRTIRELVQPAWVELQKDAAHGGEAFQKVRETRLSHTFQNNCYPEMEIPRFEAME
jgi:hypothetical protein